MANVINLKYSSVASKVPQTTDLVLGELAINTADGIIYLKDNSNNIISVKRQRSDAEVKTAYENNSDTNAFTDAEQSKLSSLSSGGSVSESSMARILFFS